MSLTPYPGQWHANRTSGQKNGKKISALRGRTQNLGQEFRPWPLEKMQSRICGLGKRCDSMWNEGERNNPRLSAWSGMTQRVAGEILCHGI